jgi:hypothetical protein
MKPLHRLLQFMLIGSILILTLTPSFLMAAEERVIGEGEYKGLIVNQGEQVFKVSPIQPGQRLQAFLNPQWTVQRGGKVEWRLEDPSGAKLRSDRQKNPESETILMEWTSNSEPLPNAYVIRVAGSGGSFPGEILGYYQLRVMLWPQNDGGSGTDAPERFERALYLPVSEPGLYFFDQCFLSGTADVYDIYKIFLKPGYGLTLIASPLEWRGSDGKAKVRWEFLNRSFRRLKTGECAFSRPSTFEVKVMHPAVRGGAKPALFYFLGKIEGDASLRYSLQLETKEGR